MNKPWPAASEVTLHIGYVNVKNEHSDIKGKTARKNEMRLINAL